MNVCGGEPFLPSETEMLVTNAGVVVNVELPDVIVTACGVERVASTWTGHDCQRFS